METPSYFVLPSCGIGQLKSVLDLVHPETNRTYPQQQFFMEIFDKYRAYIPVYTDSSRDENCVSCASGTVIFIRLPNSAFIFITDVLAIIKAMEESKDSVASKYIIFTDSLLFLQALLYMKLEHPLIGMVTRTYSSFF